MTTRRSISDEEAARIQSCPALSTIMPIVFDNGAKVDNLLMACSCCGADKTPEDIRVDATITGISAALNLWLVCYKCCLLTPATMRLRDDGTSLVRDPHNFWHEGRYAKEKPVGLISWCKVVLSKLILK